jgi:hypothetical protein
VALAASPRRYRHAKLPFADERLVEWGNDEHVLRMKVKAENSDWVTHIDRSLYRVLGHNSVGGLRMIFKAESYATTKSSEIENST